MKDQELLALCNKYLAYDPETGIITNKITRHGSIIGAEVGCLHPLGYLIVGLNYKTYRAHRLGFLMYHHYLPPYLDHVNLDKTDNHISNLRPCNHSQNAMNCGLKSTNKSGYKGVSRVSRGTSWCARLMVNGKPVYLGCYNDKHEAAEAYNEAAREHHGEFAHLNIIKQTKVGE